MAGAGKEARDAEELAALADIARRHPHRDDVFGELARRVQPDLLALCRGIVRDDALAEDCAQEALVRAWLGIGRLRDPSRFVGWTRAIAARLCLDALRARRRSSDGDGHADAAGEDMAREQAEQRIDLLRALERLPPEARAAVLLRAEGNTHAEIAGALGISESAAKMRTHRAMQRLREWMTDP